VVLPSDSPAGPAAERHRSAARRLSAGRPADSPDQSCTPLRSAHRPVPDVAQSL